MWERLDDIPTFYYSFRLWIPEGWIVRSVVDGSVHQVIVNDPLHTWTLGKKDNEGK